MSTSRTIPPTSAIAARGYGEVIHGLSRDGVALRAAVFNEREVRVVAGLTMTLAAVALAYASLAGAWLPIRVVAVALFVEFLIRVTAGLGHSPMGRLAGWVARREAPEWVSAKPKRFAWTLALVMSLVLSLVLAGGVRGALPLAMFSVFVTLMWCEAVLGLCLGCEIHGLLVRRGWAARDEAFEVCAQGACLPPALTRRSA